MTEWMETPANAWFSVIVSETSATHGKTENCPAEIAEAFVSQA
jgi:hypothetical protein